MKLIDIIIIETGSDPVTQRNIVAYGAENEQGDKGAVLFGLPGEDLDFVVSLDPVAQGQQVYLLTDISTSGYGPGRYEGIDETIELYRPEIIILAEINTLFANQLAEDWR